jgi:hypothetical protein
MWILALPDNEVRKHSLEPGQRYVATIESEGNSVNISWGCGMLTLGEGRLYIMFSEARRKAAGLPDVTGTEFKLLLKPDTSKYGVPMPEEFQAMLDMDSEFDRKFHAQTPGFQRTVLHFVGGFKSEAKRLEHGTRLMRNILDYPGEKVNIGAIMRKK